MAVNLDNIPQELKDRNQWCDYKLEDVDGKITKVPYQLNGQRASSTNPATWATFTAARTAYEDIEGIDGICLMLSEDNGIVFIDLDDCIEDGIIAPWAEKTVKKFNSYTERSQSGQGLHILIKGIKPGTRCRKASYPHKIEIYSRSRQCCVTGDALNGHHVIEQRQEELNKLYSEIFGKESTKEPCQSKKSTDVWCGLSDSALLLKAETAKNGQKFKDLWNGSLLGYGGDDSAADMALIEMLAFWTGGNYAQMERLFSQSRLGQRDKWRDRPDYRDRTIKAAISGTTKFYEPSKAEQEQIAQAAPTISEEMPEEEFEAFSLPQGPRFECKLPKDHFLQRFMGYGSDVSDAYPEFWFAGGLHALAIVADKKVCVKLRQGTIYPNLYIALLGKSTVSRKSTVVDKTEALLDDIWPFLIDAKVPTDFSPEAFVEHMDNYNHCPWIRDEAAGVLSLMKKDYMRGFKDLLMVLYDCKAVHRKLRTSQRKNAKTDFKVDDPYLNLLWATTGASFGANTEPNDTLSGFLARFVYFYPQNKKTNWLPLEEGSARNSALEDVVRTQLIGIANRMCNQDQIALHIGPEATQFFNLWQKTREDQWTGSKDDFNIQIYGRMVPIIIKLCTLFELGSPDFNQRTACKGSKRERISIGSIDDVPNSWPSLIRARDSSTGSRSISLSLTDWL